MSEEREEYKTEKRNLYLKLPLVPNCQAKLTITGTVTPETIQQLIMFLELTKAAYVEAKKANQEE